MTGFENLNYKEGVLVGEQSNQRNILDFFNEWCIMKLSKTPELVPAERTISVYRSCRKTLPVARPGATSGG
jgi:hypothetical protein